MAGQRLGIGVVGAGRWAGLAHLPGWARDERCRIVGVCDREPERVCSVQSSFVTVGNYPGIEVRVYGSEGAAVARLIEEFGICETLRMAKPDDVEFREVEVPSAYYPPGGGPRESWRTLYYANLTANFASEVLGEIEGNEGNFDDGLWVQEVINAVEISHHERRWVSLPIDAPFGAAESRAR